jgi:Putative prokaryotic signal transducing protein
MKQVFVARTPTEAHLVKGVLETRGIRAEVRGEALWGTRGEIPLTPDTLPTVWVLDDRQAPEGVRIVEEYSSSEASASGLEDQGWRCPACGEQLEAQFSECWKCGASRPA